MITSSTLSDATPARFSASLITVAPRSVAGTSFNEPRNEPIAERTALTITTSFDISISPNSLIMLPVYASLHYNILKEG